MSERDLDLTLPTRDGECIEITTARWSQMGVAEVTVTNPTTGSYSICATTITAKQARELATAFDRLAAFWGE